MRFTVALFSPPIPPAPFPPPRGGKGAGQPHLVTSLRLRHHRELPVAGAAPRRESPLLLQRPNPEAVAATAQFLRVVGRPTGATPVQAQSVRQNQMWLLAPLSRPAGERGVGGESGKKPVLLESKNDRSERNIVIHIIKPTGRARCGGLARSRCRLGSAGRWRRHTTRCRRAAAVLTVAGAAHAFTAT